MKLTVLMENSACRTNVQAEHGLSLYLETEHHKILFDTGASDAFAKNAARLGVDLAGVDVAVLSHGHYDHSGGLACFLERNDHAPVYLSRHAFEPHLAAQQRDIGVDPALEGNSRFLLTGDELVIDEELTLSSCNSRPRPYGEGSEGMFTRRAGLLIPDDFRHEQYLLIREGGKRVLLSGCSHKGILNIMEWFRPDVLVGGFHFMGLRPGAELARAAEVLNRYDCQYYTSHCTGIEQYAFLKGLMGDRLHYLGCGQRVVI